MFTQGSYLRVLTPRTTNGNNIMVNEDGVLQYKEAHLPMSARPSLELLNRNTPQHLRKKIEVVRGNIKDKEQKTDQKLIDAQKQIELLQKQLAQMQQAQVATKPPENPSKLKA